MLEALSTRKLLPTEVAVHSSAQSCYVTLDRQIHDVTKLLKDHPGGGDLILNYGGQDVSEIMGHKPSHKHSKEAYERLGESLTGYFLVTNAYERPCERADANSLAALPPVYCETSIDSQTDPLTFIKPRMGLLENRQLALAQRKIAGSAKTYYLDPLRFMHTKSKASGGAKLVSVLTFVDGYYLKDMRDAMKVPSNSLSDQRLWYRVVLRTLYSLEVVGATLARAVSLAFTSYGLALALLVAVLTYDRMLYIEYPYHSSH